MDTRRLFLKKIARLAAGGALGAGAAYLLLKKKVRVQACGLQMASCVECPVNDGCRLKKD